MKTSGVTRLQHLTSSKLEQARTLRRSMTPAEKLLWNRLRGKQLGVRFRRQQIIEGFIADFFRETEKLVIEVDGAVHNTAAQIKIDMYRRKEFENRGLQELRFSNDQIESEIELAIDKIAACIPICPPLLPIEENFNKVHPGPARQAKSGAFHSP